MPRNTKTDGKSTGHRSHRLDVIIVACILVVALAGYGFVRWYGSSGSADEVRITQSDGQTITLPLDKDTCYVVTTDLGTNTVCVENGTVHIEDADCKNLLCEKQGTIDTPGQTLICLPHKLVVEIVSSSGDDSTGYDAISR